MSKQAQQIRRLGTLVFIGVLVTGVTAGAAKPAKVANSAAYILNGYGFQDMKGVNSAELEAKLKQKAGARITAADIETDRKIVQKEIEARHLKGQVFVIVAEKKGRAWLIFDLLDLSGPPKGAPVYRLESQHFEGASLVSASALAAATALHEGETLSDEKIKAARRAILSTYAKQMPGRKITLKLRLQFKTNGGAKMTWIVGEPKPVPATPPRTAHQARSLETPVR